MRRNIRKGAAVVMSLLLAFGSINVTAYAQDQSQQDAADTEITTEGTNAEELSEESAVQEEPAPQEPEYDSEEAAAEVPMAEEEKSPAGRLRFVDAGTGEDLGEDCVRLDTDAVYDGGAFSFDALDAGSVISYTVEKEGYITVRDSFVIYEEDETVEVDLKRKTSPAEGSVTVEIMYGEKGLSVYDYMDIGDSYDGEPRFEMTEGDYVAEVSEDGTITIKNAVQAAIKITFPETETSIEAETYVTLTVNRMHIGDIVAEDIEWDNTEKGYDSLDGISLTGTVKDSVGIV